MIRFYYDVILGLQFWQFDEVVEDKSKKQKKIDNYKQYL